MVNKQVVKGSSLSKTYVSRAEKVHALRDAALDLHSGELVALVGPSGSGKSTLLNVLCGWEHPEAGKLEWDDALAGGRPEDFAWADLALIPQALGLLEDLTLDENIMLPARLAGRRQAERAAATELMKSFGIAHLANRYPHQASLGEQQRVAVARALLLRPSLLLADEPTAHQDAHWTDVLFTAFRDLAESGSACLIASHNPATWEYADRILTMRDGELRVDLPEAS